MRIVCACTSYWNTPEEFHARLTGHSLRRVDPVTGNVAHTLYPEYEGRFGLVRWRDTMLRLFPNADLFIACGTWSCPDVPDSCLSSVRVINSGVLPTRPHTMGWQYMGCALTALMAHLCNRRDWDVLLLLEADVLLGAVNWDDLLRQFLGRPEEVFGPRWFERHCDFIGFKPAAAARFLHQRLRPNLTEDKSVMWLDDELATMFKGVAWNPWPEVRTIRRDFFHAPSQWEGCPDNAESMTWPMIRMPDPAIIDEYERTQSSLAVPVRPGV